MDTFENNELDQLKELISEAEPLEQPAQPERKKHRQQIPDGHPQA